MKKSQSLFSSYLDNLKNYISQIDPNELQKMADILTKAYDSGQTVYVIGNGGSASTASHVAVDLAKTVRGHKGDSKHLGFKVNCLSDNVGLITAWANDTGYERVFSGQLENLGQKGDVLIAISSSGNSNNILQCVKTAKKLKMKTLGIAGFKGGKLKDMCDLTLVCNCEEYGPVEDIQLIINHAITNYFVQFLKNRTT